ncbi:unnamed protein product, partial [marine sediment metagenome]
IEESLTYTVEVRDKEGRVLQHISAPSRSYVQGWNKLVNVGASGASKTITDTAGNPIVIPIHAVDLKLDAGIAAILWGLRVGKGTTAVAITDYALETPCLEGTGLDEFNHQAVTFTEPLVAGPTCSFTVKRTMINNSGALISGIKELGAYNGHAGVGSGSVLGFRDVLGTAVDVPDGGAITVEYTLGVTA